MVKAHECVKFKNQELRFYLDLALINLKQNLNKWSEIRIALD